MGTEPKSVCDRLSGATVIVAALCAFAVAPKVIDPPGLALNVSVPLRGPIADGRNDTAMLQVPPRPSAAVQVFALVMTSVGLLLVSAGMPVIMSPPLDTF